MNNEKGMSNAIPTSWQIMETAQDVAISARDMIIKCARQSIQQRGSFNLVLAGGTTPHTIYSLLADEDCQWNKWQLYLGDERCLPADDKERNSQLVQQSWLNQIDIPTRNIHFIPAERGPIQAAKDYEKIVREALPFDMVLLGMGEDGHTASLFPGHQYTNGKYVYPVFKAPKPPPERVTLSAAALSNTQNLLILVSGKSKREAIHRWRKGENLPVSQIKAIGKKTVLLDKEAYL